MSDQQKVERLARRMRRGRKTVTDVDLWTLFVVQSLSCVQLFAAMDCSKSGLPILHCLPEFAQTLAY